MLRHILFDRLLIEKYKSEHYSNYVSAYERVSAGTDPYMANLVITDPFFSSLDDSFAFAAANSGVSWWYDNCASVSVVDALSKLVECEALSLPFRIGGIVGGIMITHREYIPFLPRSIALAYFSCDATACLISLGYVQSQSGSYRSVGVSQLVVCAPGDVVIDVADLGPNRLTAVSSQLLSAVLDVVSPIKIMPVVRSRPLPFKPTTRASGPISYPVSRAPSGLCLTVVSDSSSPVVLVAVVRRND